MMPILTHFDRVYDHHTDSQSRRLAILNRARREEVEAMLFATPERHNVTRTGNTTRKREGAFSRTKNRMRAAIGNTLIAAGNRIQSSV